VIEDSGQNVYIKIPSENFPLHRINELDQATGLKLTLYRLESHIDVIRNRSDYVRDLRWEQIGQETLQLAIFVNDCRLWGYSTSINQAGNFILLIRKPPGKYSLKNLKIALDPGHGGKDWGAIGPSRIREKDLNLVLTTKIADLLKRKGAQVFLTRSEDADAELYDRLDRAEEWGADLFLSIHHNALPDGCNPASRSGLGVYYYHPQSLDLALCLYKQLLEFTGQPDDGLFYDNLAIPRATCMPSVLIEVGYIIGPEEEMLLQKGKFQKKVAQGIYQGLKDFLEIVQSEKKIENSYTGEKYWK
jgi:N-acetylmuramoyl-L-alanine amidase